MTNNKDKLPITLMYLYLTLNNINDLGDCCNKSLENFVKLRKGGYTLRVRGLRATDRIDLPEDISKLDSRKIPYHYWVERKGKVFDINSNDNEIMDIDDFYQKYDIKYIEKTSVGLMDDEIQFVEEETEYKASFKDKFLKSNIDKQNKILLQIAEIWADDAYDEVKQVYDKTKEINKCLYNI
jgi:hypothetical protein